MKDKHFAVIDKNSGYIFGDAFAETAIQACGIVDREIGSVEYEYEQVNWSDLRVIYLVYELSAAQFDLLQSEDGSPEYNGQDQALIEMVESHGTLDSYIARREIQFSC